MLRAGLIRGGSYVRMAVAFWAVTWLPLLFLSIWDGSTIGGRVHIPFLRDYAAQARLLIALPIVIIADSSVDSTFRLIMRQFVRSNIIVPADVPRYLSIVRGVSVRLDSALAEAVLVVIVVFQAFFALGSHGWISPAGSAWYSTLTPQGRVFTTAGWWFHASVAIFAFFFARWLWRLIVWAHCLWEISKLNLELIPTHPDLAGGLAFVGKAQVRFGFAVFAYSAAAAGTCANLMIYEGKTLRSLDSTIYVYLLIMIVVFVSPVLPLTPKLRRVKGDGQIEYGVLAMDYVRTFDTKWVRSRAPLGETLLGSADVQSLADMANSFDVIRRMRIFAINRKTILNLFASAAIPFVPLLLIVFPFDELMKRAWKLLF
jgi:hypothetical protein